MSLDISQPTRLPKLEGYLKDGNLLNYLTVREKLLSISYPELSRLQEEVNNKESLNELNCLVKELLSETNDIFILREDIFVNNTPSPIDSPFYPDSGKAFNISELKPYAEIAYFYNLRLPYRSNNLIQVDKQLWNNPGFPKSLSPVAHLSVEESVYAPGKLSSNASKLWSYQLKDDYVNNYFVKLRQWIKRYTEDLVFPAVYQDVVILRNEYRFFFVDILSGTELSSFPVQDIKGQEHYHTFRHPHQNSYGYEFLLSQDTLFSELNGKLAAIDIKNILQPQLIWERDLGEYTVCTKPLIAADTLLVSLVNPRCEIWFCGFNPRDGSLQWSTYIGISSFLSPVATISEIQGNKVFIGTNHGVLVCLDSQSGNIIWIRKYAPKRYSFFDYWKGGGYRDNFLNKNGSISYDTQFIKLEEGARLYYKPRESDYLYILDSKDGSLKDKILIDPTRSKLIGVCNNRGVFLTKDTPGGKKARLEVIDLSSGKELYTQPVPENVLKGVIYSGSLEILFKIDEVIYLFRSYNNVFSCTPINSQARGWLSAQGERGRFLFVVDDRMVSCLDLFKQQYPYQRTNPLLAEYLSRRKQLIDKLTGMLRADGPAAEEQKILLSEIKTSKIRLNEIYPILLDNLRSLKHPYRKDFLQGLNSIYGSEVVTYQDVEIKFSNFLRGANLINAAAVDRKMAESSATTGKDYQLKLNGETRILPIHMAKGEKLLGFYLLLSHGQLFCVSETGKILWERKIFFGPIWQSGEEHDQDKHVYASDVEACLYEDTLIINDRINVIAIDAFSGAYVWSITNKQGLFQEEGQFPPVSSEWDYQSRKLFVKYTMFYTKFIDDRLIILHGNKAYSVNPETGYCHNFLKLNTEGVMEVKVADEEIYLLSYSLKNIKVLNKDLNEIRSLPLNFLSESKEVWPEMFLVSGYVGLHLKPKLFVVNKNTGALTDTLDLSDLKRYYIEKIQEGLLVVVPLQKIMKYNIREGKIAASWRYDGGLPDKYVMWEPVNRKSKYYFSAGEYLFFIARTKGTYYITVLNISTGGKVLEKRLKGVEGPFYNLIRPVVSGGKINFIISTVYTGGTAYDKDLLSAAVDAHAEDAVTIDSRLVCFDIDRRDIIREEVLPAGAFIGYGISMIQTKNKFIYDTYGAYLKTKDKR